MDGIRSSPVRLKNIGKKRPDSLKIDLLKVPTTENGTSDKCATPTESYSSEGSVNVTFRNISYSVSEGFFKKEKKHLLNNINGDFHSAELTAIMGPSGAGKSTLMDILAGYITHGVTGQININDKVRDLSAFRKQACYIMQDDNLQPLLTVNEAMMVAVNLKLPSDLSLSEKAKKVMEILESVDLGSDRETKTFELSGGQKKRLSIALELVTNPQVMFFDEPTSGLDIVASKQCITLLKELASLNRTVICTIHQPSASILDLFHHVYVVANGSCMYQGSVNALLPYLSEVHLTCPTFHNPSDFLLEVISGDHGDYSQILIQKSKNGLSQRWRSEIPYSAKNGLREIYQTPVVTQPPVQLTCIKDTPNTYSTSFGHQLLVLLKRTFLVISRDKTLTYNRLLTHFCIAIFIGILYYGIGSEAGDMYDNFKFMFFSAMFLMLTSFNCVTTTFPSELPIITREYFNKWYSLKSYYLALTFADIPVQICATLLYGSVTYFLTKQPVESFRIVSFLFMCVLISLVAQSFGLFIGACMDVKNGVIFGPFCMLPFTIFSGFFVQLNACHPSMRWLFHISFLKYGFEGMVLSVFGYDRPKLPCNSEYCHYSRPEKFLSNMDMAKSTYSLAVIFLGGLIVAIRISAYFVLRVQVRRSRGKRR
ncbi:ATP-binding cassette sub-family G member 1 isoform X1 [Dendroctonus ponderosae]|uniref:ABC transporter domain-containing protein n=1 Tax=Dendroctonus ponderosae TaxID=77166 RepID=U4UDC0_DENPD|nr:ATP-binding cassette sub-family G member 1 isoform X1 [Dendroctonus ponderosae]ERL88591.1 hypothetical protein D910_05976 [Dendroctonus ponderosae]KAH1026363.1 hypothetical protein HUJ05_000037 [Dendroctonus ponderosae]